MFNVFCVAMVAVCYHRLYKAQTEIKAVEMQQAGTGLFRKPVFDYNAQRGHDAEFERWEINDIVFNTAPCKGATAGDNIYEECNTRYAAQIAKGKG
jgi:hypothetical protein